MTEATLRRTLPILALPALLALPAAVPAQEAAVMATDETPERVILLIGDGVGIGYWTAARLAADRLAIERFPVVGLVDTRSADNRVTDSAAAATAYAAGVRTYNYAIGVDPDTVPVETVLEYARDRGMATGIVATSSVTHATPASFVAHVPDRWMYYEIAAQIAENPPDVVLGGGLQFFHPWVRPDSVNLLAPLSDRYRILATDSAFEATDFDDVDRVLGLFADDAMGAAGSRTPTLSAMTDAALRVLGRDEDGFFLLIEGSQPDWFGHDNAPLDSVVAEVLDFDRAIGVALDYQERHPETLVVATADHETGGLALQLDSAGVFGYGYTTVGHTGEMVPLFAKGPGAARFGGIRDNDEVGRILMELVRQAARQRAGRR